MANFLYNGVELPDINTVWTDKETYPYAYIDKVEEAALGFFGCEFLAVFSTHSAIFYPEDGAVKVAPALWKYELYLLKNGVWEFYFTDESTDPDHECMSVGEPGAYSVIWTNYDILNDTDGSVYLAASTPIRVDSRLKISVGGGSANGDGYALYNGVKLPKLPEWDKADYPYAFLSQGSGSDYGDANALVCALYLPSSPGVFTDGGVNYTESFSLTEWFFTDSQVVVDLLISVGISDVVVGQWYSAGERDVEVQNPHIECLGEPLWSSYDISDASGNVQLAASDPIPLDGYTVIEWDGNTEGLESLDNMWFKVSDNVADKEAAKNGIVVMSDNIISDTGYHMELSDDVLGLETGSVILVYADGADLEGITAEHKGTYFLNAAMYTQLFAYKAISSDGGVTDTTATVEFICTDLENTEPIDSIKAWVYKKSDGLNTTIPPTWTSEMFSAPAYSTTHTFTDLEPNTEYEVYGCIFVNDEATDHNALAVFTTLEGDSNEEPPIYDRDKFLAGLAIGLTGKSDPISNLSGSNGSATDNSIYIAASTPIPAGGSTSGANGDGYALYNGVKLPNIDSVWDKTKYPYVFITHANTEAMIGINANVAFVYMSDVKPTRRGNIFFAADFEAGSTSFVYLFTDNQEVASILSDLYASSGLSVDIIVDEWCVSMSETYEHDTTVGFFEDMDFTWANFDVINKGVTNVEDGTIHIAASDPIPLDGYTVIEWDGNTDGLVTTGTLCKMSDDVLTSEQVVGGIYVQNVSSTLTTIKITSDSISEHESGIVIDEKIYSAPATSLLPEAGTYFPYLGGDHVSILAYPANTGSIASDSFMKGYLVGSALRRKRVIPKIVKLAEKNTWYKGSADKSSFTEINLVDTYTPTGTETESWAADADETGAIMCYVDGGVLTIAGNGSGKIMANENSTGMFRDFSGINSINNLALLDTTNVTRMTSTFSKCSALTSLDVSGFNTSNVTNMSYMFSECSALASLDVSGFNTSNVTNMSYMFSKCSALASLDVGGFNTSNVTNMIGMFSECNALTLLDVSGFDTSSVTDIREMFFNCSALTALDISSFNTINATDMTCMFMYCSKLKTIYVGDGWDTSNADVRYMFLYCGVSSVTHV